METKDYISLSYEQKIDIMVNSPKELNLPDEASVLAEYLAQYRPILPPQDNEFNETSVELQDVVNTIADLELNVVTRMMKMLGYRLYFRGYNVPAWSMRQIELQSEDC